MATLNQLSATLIQFWNVFQVALGLGFVIFLHELGHFLLAKWNGVKVEKFSIGFGPTLVGFTRGETEYVLAAVPLGGFVKMLGEGLEEGESTPSDPRAYPNKSVGARMAIISAGVIMNLILGLACFVWAYGRGMEESPATIGAVFADSPAYKAGLRAGDEIVAIDGRRDISFDNVLLKVRLSGTGQVVHFEVKHPGQTGDTPIDVKPERDEGLPMPTIGVSQANSLILALPDKPEDLPAWMKPGGKVLDLRDGDKVIAVGPEGEEPRPVADAYELDSLLARDRARPLAVVFEHTPEPRKGQPRPEPVRVTATLPVHHFVTFGFRLTAEPVSSVQGGGLAEKAGIRAGDRIVKVNGAADFDPMTLPDLCYKQAGSPLTIELERPGAGGTAETHTLTITPDATPPWVRPLVSTSGPLDVPGLGLAYPVRPRIAAIQPGSPAEKAGLRVGDVLDALTLPDLKPPKRTRWTWLVGLKKPEPFRFGDKDKDKEAVSWPGVFELLQLMPSRPVELTVNGSKQPIRLTPEADDAWFHPYRGVQFKGLVRDLSPLGVSAALRRGFDDTVDNILGIYAMLRSLMMGRVSPKMLGGPGTIASVAYHSASKGLTKLIHFLGILSINLAVLNFLPVPPLDGGQMVFLIAEKVRGRPLPERALAAGTYAGLVLVLGLMAWVICQDVARFAGF